MRLSSRSDESPCGAGPGLRRPLRPPGPPSTESAISRARTGRRGRRPQDWSPAPLGLLLLATLLARQLSDRTPLGPAAIPILRQLTKT